eukprot:m.1079330 g.1079330  ORF g.1079330 m.1079330 type:complete len:90 (+) comp24254_c0_seq57:2322-2591(+)
MHILHYSRCEREKNLHTQKASIDSGETETKTHFRSGCGSGYKKLPCATLATGALLMEPAGSDRRSSPPARCPRAALLNASMLSLKNVTH